MTEKLDLRIGALAPSVPRQMEMQGRVFENKAHESLSDNFKESITILKIHGIISYGEADKAANRLVKWLAKNTKTKQD